MGAAIKGTPENYPKEIIKQCKYVSSDYKLPDYLGNISIDLAIEDFSLVIGGE